jgi:hypothetical protein
MVVAALLTGLYDLVPTWLVLRLWPSSIVGIGDPHTVSEKLLTAAVSFGGQFLLYGIGGLLLGGSVWAVRSFVLRR